MAGGWSVAAACTQQPSMRLEAHRLAGERMRPLWVSSRTASSSQTASDALTHAASHHSHVAAHAAMAAHAARQHACRARTQSGR